MKKRIAFIPYSLGRASLLCRDENTLPDSSANALVIEHQFCTLQSHTRGMIRSRKIKRGTDLIFGILPCIAANVEGASGEHRGDFPLPLQVSETVFPIANRVFSE